MYLVVVQNPHIFVNVSKKESLVMDTSDLKEIHKQLEQEYKDYKLLLDDKPIALENIFIADVHKPFKLSPNNDGSHELELPHDELFSKMRIGR
eukprot:TRINITY_DN2409_c0_g1_i2.p1 TRINITY_DN2409_c0_g1~~TRINITY_DN2409_c0_g1_i2.p1  ORF type:complete len:107 (+),score=19.57 TRINITY_DN2409_c0_g1_i2:45-323(+)